MDQWNQLINSWTIVIIQIAVGVAVTGLTWNALPVIAESAFGGNGHSIATYLARFIGIVLALVLVISAPQIVSDLRDVFVQPLVP